MPVNSIKTIMLGPNGNAGPYAPAEFFRRGRVRAGLAGGKDGDARRAPAISSLSKIGLVWRELFQR
jgi:hypothetical protein